MVAQALELSRKPHVVIATPGRLADHLRSSNTFSLKKLKFLVRQFSNGLGGGVYASKIFFSSVGMHADELIYFQLCLGFGRS